MHTSHSRPFTGSIPYLLLLAIATACSAADEPRASANFSDKQRAEHADGADGEGGASSESQTTAEPGTRPKTETPSDPETTRDDPSVDEPKNAAQGANEDGEGGNEVDSPAKENDDDTAGTDGSDDGETAPNASDNDYPVNGSGNQANANADANANANADANPNAANADRDGDGLSDSVETNTGKFQSRTNTGTDPQNWDSDGDGISDGDEVLGTAAGLNLPAMGTNPLRKNILIEYDWFDDSNECVAHSHRPTPAALNLVSSTFAESPVSNPDGTRGITVIHDYGQGGVFSGGNRINDSDGVIAGGVRGSDYLDYRAKNFASNRQGYFHYALLPHRYNTNDGSSGQAEIVGGNLIVSLYCAKTDHNVAATIVHELGHNLGLLHGGNEDTNYKPNYNSVMNYAYQFAGIDTNCTPSGDGIIDYSHNRLIPLDESALDERKGMCGTSSWDWNANGSIESRVSMDLNRDSTLSVLNDHDDWGAIVLDWARRSRSLAKRDLSSPDVASCDSRPPGY